MRSQTEPIRELRRYLRARETGMWILSVEETLVEQAVATAAALEGYHARIWDCATGCRSPKGLKIEFPGSETLAGVIAEIRAASAAWERENDNEGDTAQQAAALGAQTVDLACEDRIVWILRDVPELLQNPGPDTAEQVRALRSLVQDLQAERKAERWAAVVLVTVRREMPETLREELVFIDWPLPNREQMTAIISETVASAWHIPQELEKTALPAAFQAMGGLPAILDAAAGLTSTDAARSCALSLIKEKRKIQGKTLGIISPELIIREKRKIIERAGLLQWHEPHSRGLDAIGGLGPFKAWAKRRARAFGLDAQAFGLPNPRGVLLLGPPGVGKSLAAKALATAYRIPLIRLDLGALKSKWVGESEANIRKALKVVEAVERAVLWIDEFDKALSGSRGAAGDGGVSSDQLGVLLTWREEFQGGIMLIATGNNPAAIPPEMQARFDASFFVDLPHAGERFQVLTKILEEINGRRKALGKCEEIPLDRLGLAAVAAMKEADGFSGRELKHAVEEALAVAFDGNRALAQGDLETAVRATVPGSRAEVELIDRLRAWGKERARPANDPEPKLAPQLVAAAPSRGRMIDSSESEI